MSNAIEITNLSKTYPGFKLDHINLTLPQGCIMGLIGENGAGKSTTIKLMLDLIRRESGEISILGNDNPHNITSIKEHLGIVMDETFFPENITAKNINLIMRNIYKTWDSNKFSAMIEHFSLPSAKAFKDYSHGMKMKLAIAIALSHDSQLLILDEATSGLDPIARNEILDAFMDFIQDEVHSVLISSHILSDLEKICDYICFIHQGKIIFCEAKDELLNKYSLIKCSNEEFDKIDPSIVINFQRNNFGVEALVKKETRLGDYITEKPSIEDIMLYTIKK